MAEAGTFLAEHAVNPAHALSQRQEAALEELRLFRTTLDSLRARLPGLEHFVANAQLKEEDSAELDDVVKAFGDPATDLSALREEAGEPSSSQISPAISRRASGVHDERRSGAQEPPQKKARLVEPKKEEDQSGSNVEAAVSLEFYTLGRPRTWAEAGLKTDTSDGGDGLDLPSSPTHHLAVLPPESQTESPTSRFPDGASLQAVEPGEVAEGKLLRVGLDQFGFHHSVVHAPTFRSQLAAFRSLGDDRFSRASLPWLSLYFALLAVSAKLISRDQTTALGWTDDMMFKSASDWFECSVACLYRANFLQAHDFSALQAIAVLVLSGRDAGSATLIATLLSSGLSIAQDMGLHRMPSDEQWDAALEGKPARLRARSLVEREIRKRVLWALVHSEHFAIPFKGYSLLAKVQISTPLPLNATDEDLATGQLFDRPRDEYTVPSWLLRYVEIGRLMARAFEHSTSEKATASQAYHSFLEADKQLEALLSDVPAWLKKDADTAGLPEDAEVIRSTFLISLQHKMLSVHRPFLAKPSRATTYAFSRRRVIEAARAILREAPLVRENRIWTSIYHISVALFSLTLELYEQLKQASPDNEAIRQEIADALPTLEGLKDVSAIAERGLGLVLPLLADEKRMREEGGQLKEKRKAKPAGPSRKNTSTGSSASLPPSAALAGASASLASPAPTSPFANPFVPTASPSAADAGTSFSFGAPAPQNYDPSAPTPSLPLYGGYPIPPWLAYGEQFSYAVSGLDGGAPGGSAPGSATPAAAGGGFANPYAAFGPYGAAPPAAGIGAMGWGMMPPAMPGHAPGAFGAGMGWDWASLAAAATAGGPPNEGESPARVGEGDGAQS
ncbi:hypothetical protein JCM10213_003130 [Rhodosporidiobolus nylandii]